jgi:hypothetical protein
MIFLWFLGASRVSLSSINRLVNTKLGRILGYKQSWGKELEATSKSSFRFFLFPFIFNVILIMCN